MEQKILKRSMTLEQMEEKYEHLRITDDFIFSKIMQNKVLCIKLLECLTGNQIGDVEEIVVQKSVKATNDSKGVRYDVYVDDGQGRVYDAEMQNKPSRAEELPRRSRFYQELIDLNELEKGDHYINLKDSYVIFICTYDPFDKGLCCYSFSNLCHEDFEIPFCDGREILFFNTKGNRNNVSNNIVEFLDYVENGDVKGIFSKQLDQAVKMARKNREWKVEYMRETIRYMDAKREGLEEGRQEGRMEERENSIRILIETYHSLQFTFEQTVNKVMETYSMDLQKTTEKVALYWNA